MKKLLVPSAALLLSSPTFAALDSASIVSEITSNTNSVVAVMTAIIGISVLFVGFRFIKKVL